MEIGKYGRAEVTLPHVDDDLHEVGHLEGHAPIRHYLYTGRSIRQLSIAERILSNGRISKIEAQRATFSRANFQSARIEHCVFGSAEWDECTLSRVVFRNCKILGATFSDNKWANVIFDGCKIEYTSFESVQASAPVVFVDTSFKEVTFVGCDLPGGHMSGCELKDVEFVGGGYDEFDLRGNDLSTIRGAANLDGAVISSAQRHELAEALVSELNFRYIDDGAR